MSDSYSLPYGYQDFSSASTEAYQHSWDAYNAGDMTAANYWNTVSQQDTSTSNDLYYGNVDPYGSASPSTIEGYYPGDWTSAYEGGGSAVASATPAADTAGWSSSTFDSGASSSLISNGDMHSVL